ncbi:MAG TPA: AarF/ABC1/UbiB kinase family protein [Chloroflexi bacterium]|nr:AarF/ABC1/UbiB kinase family protein [Chloroflexota bacterium]
MTAGTIPVFSRPVRHLQRYREILSVFTRHGFGFALSHLPAEPLWLRELHPFPRQEPASLPYHFRCALEELGPTFVKLGQILSTRPDVLPPSYIEELSNLQDKVQPLPWDVIEPVIREELDRPLSEVFEEIHTVPLASASLAQVHTARLVTRERVVLKVQRPHILRTLKTDLEIIHDIARYVQNRTPLGRLYDLVGIADDFADTLNNELDYRVEGRNADRFRENFRNEPAIHIPRVYWAYTSRRLLVMEYIEGIKIDDIETLDQAGFDRDKIARNAARMIIQEVLLDGFFHADPHPGNFVVMEGEVIGAMDFGIVGFLSQADRVNLIRLYTAAVQMNAKGVADDLIHIGAAPPDVDRQGLTRDIARLLHRYEGMPLQEIRMQELMAQIRPLAFEYRLRFPTDLWLLTKTLSMMEGIGLRLSPGFDIFEFSRPYVTRLMVQAVLPKRTWGSEALRRGLAWTDLLDELPYAGRLLIDRLEKREPMRLALEQESLAYLDRLATRLALSMIIAGMIIGLAWLIPTVSAASWVVQAVVGISFLTALLLGAWFVWSVIRRH